MSRVKFYNYLNKIQACDPAVKWVKKKTLKPAWERCENPLWMMWLVLEISESGPFKKSYQGEYLRRNIVRSTLDVLHKYAYVLEIEKEIGTIHHKKRYEAGNESSNNVVNNAFETIEMIDNDGFYYGWKDADSVEGFMKSLSDIIRKRISFKTLNKMYLIHKKYVFEDCEEVVLVLRFGSS
ncbi:MAG TPA: hypothetical protein VMX17_12755 [Candidatus Glassbacteria bacterium]|nr:hypothetical protein [Candidatus Glassbacteria bacterium]